MSSRSADTNPDSRPENPNVNAEQVATLSEGKVADAVSQNHGSLRQPDGQEPVLNDFTSDLDKKKAEQASARDAIKEARSSGENVDGSLGEGRLANESASDV